MKVENQEAKPDVGPLQACPHCGSKEGYAFILHGVAMKYAGWFGRGRDSETVVEQRQKLAAPKFAKCEACGKQIRISRCRGEA